MNNHRNHIACAELVMKMNSKIFISLYNYLVIGGNYMSKPKRGSNAKRIPNWRGTCISCGRKRVKLLWIKTGLENSKANVCKRCGI